MLLVCSSFILVFISSCLKFSDFNGSGKLISEAEQRNGLDTDSLRYQLYQHTIVERINIWSDREVNILVASEEVRNKHPFTLLYSRFEKLINTT